MAYSETTKLSCSCSRFSVLNTTPVELAWLGVRPNTNRLFATFNSTSNLISCWDNLRLFTYFQHSVVLPLKVSIQALNITCLAISKLIRALTLFVLFIHHNFQSL